jgi:restriction endonuclease S subunit
VFAVKRGEINGIFGLRNAEFIKNNPYPKKLQSGYTIMSLSQILEEPLQNGIFKTKDYYGNGVLLVNVFDLYQGLFIDEKSLERIDITASEQTQYSAEAGDVFFCRSSIKPEGVAWTNCILHSGEPMTFECHLIKVRPNKDIASPLYLSEFCKTKIARQYLLSKASVTTMATIDQTSIRNLPIILPPLKEQKRLEELLINANNVRQLKLREAEELLVGMDGFVLKRLGIGEIPVQKHIVSAVTLRTLKNKSTIGAEYYHPERLAVIRAIENDPNVSTRRLTDIVEFLRNTVSADGKEYLGLAGVVSNTGELSGTEETAEGQAFLYSAGDVLYARLRPYLNKVLFAETGGVCSTEFHVMRVNSADVQPEYLAAIMRSKIIVAQTKHMMTGNTHPRISNDDVRNLLIPVPPMDIQRIIVSEMRKRIECSRRLKHEAETEWLAAKERFERELTGETSK